MKLLVCAFLLSLSAMCFAKTESETCIIDRKDLFEKIAALTNEDVLIKLADHGIRIKSGSYIPRFYKDMSPGHAMNLYYSATMETESGVELEIERTDITYLGKIGYDEKLPDGTPVNARCEGHPQDFERKINVRNVRFNTIALSITPEVYFLYSIP